MALRYLTSKPIAAVMQNKCQAPRSPALRTGVGLQKAACQNKTLELIHPDQKLSSSDAAKICLYSDFTPQQLLGLGWKKMRSEFSPASRAGFQDAEHPCTVLGARRHTPPRRGRARCRFTTAGDLDHRAHKNKPNKIKQIAPFYVLPAFTNLQGIFVLQESAKWLQSVFFFPASPCNYITP